MTSKHKTPDPNNPKLPQKTPIPYSNPTPTTTRISETAHDIKLVSISESLISTLNLHSTSPEQSEKPKSWLADKYTRYKKHQVGTTARFVRMPATEYEKYWARDEKGHYCGTEPEGCDEARRLLRLRLEDEGLQRYGRKNVSSTDYLVLRGSHGLKVLDADCLEQVEEDIIRDWKPLSQRSGWAHTAVGAVPGVT